MMKKHVFALLVLLALLCVSAACAEGEITALSQLNDPVRTIGVSTGSVSERTVTEELPLAKISYYNDKFLGYADVAAGKIDAFVYDLAQMKLSMQSGLQGVRLLTETLGQPVQIAVGISRVSRIPELTEKINRFLAEIRADGTLDGMYTRWVLSGDEALPEIEKPASPQGLLVVGTTGNVPPYSYYSGTQLTGYDIELAYRFAAWLGMDIAFEVMDFGAVVPAAQSGKVDCVMSNLQISPERQESFQYSDILYEERQGVLVRDGGDSAAAGLPGGDVYTALAQLDGKPIGVQTGSNFAEMVAERLPEATVEYYNGKADLVAALTGHKIEAFVVDEPVAQLVVREDSRVTYLPEYLDSYSFALVFAKDQAGQALRDQFDAFLDQLPDGTLDALAAKWFGEDEAAKTMPDIAALPAENGVLRLATESGYAPFEYVRDGQVVGYDMELAALFCQAAGYGLEIVDMNFDGILPAIQTGKCDFAAAGISVTPERAESVLFSQPNFSGGTVAMVLKAQETAVSDPKAETFWEGIASSFTKTFLRENRWQLFLEGIGNTMLITLLSILFGTALGFLLFMLCRNGSHAANGATRFSLWLVQGTPMVVLLMILYYIIFGSVSISGIAVAVIGFTLTFGAAVFGLIKMGVGTIDRGQYEAAYALGHSNRHTFFRIILPQAIPHVLPAYQGEIVGLIKSTAIVGYIAVQDLTKMGDIVRSRTYEAFFPLIAVTVIYFVLEGLFSLAVSRIRLRVDPKRRKRERILKGVDIHD